MVLGVKLSPDRRYLYFVDSKAGMCRLDLTNSTIELLTSGYNGAPFSYLNNFDVAEDGKIYMADSTTKYSSS
jgi:sugar lactone lactonase YvrE